MSFISSLRARASAVLSRASGSPEPPVAAHSAEPRASKLGVMPFVAAGPAPLAENPPEVWDIDPETGVPLPAGPSVKVGPTEWTAARVAHRLGWFPALAHRAANGDEAARELALTTLERWLRQDLPGHGIAWAHPSDLAARLVHVAAGVGFLGGALPDALREALAGSAAWHLDHLALRMPQREDEGLRRVIHHAGRVVGGFLFPDLPQARAAWSEGLAGLKDELPALMFLDGAPRDVAPLALAESLWFAALARAVARANGAGFPGEADAALSRGARLLERLTGSIGALPPIGDRPVDTVLAAAGYPVGWSLWNLAVAFGIDAGDGAPRPGDDPRLRWLGLTPPAEPPAPAGKSWTMWVWREAGVVLSETKIKNKPSRVVGTFATTGRGSPLTHPAPLSFTWDIGDVRVIADPGPSLDNPELAPFFASARSHSVLTLDGKSPPAISEGRLDLSRVDSKKARMEGHHDGWRKVGVPVTHVRKVLLNQARCVVTDRLSVEPWKDGHIPMSPKNIGRHAVQILWQLGPGWEVTQDNGQWTAKQGNLTMLLQLPENLSWTVVSGRGNPDPAGWVGREAAPCLVGSGGVEGDAEFVTSFEIR